mmetsp:Transcript_17746/g.36849  ORF Transcript_17746/g.36849 Transcript_17746/m.36849 type:complete len:86 (+) Transcript_17746:959-1216(+)
MVRGIRGENIVGQHLSDPRPAWTRRTHHHSASGDYPLGTPMLGGQDAIGLIPQKDTALAQATIAVGDPEAHFQPIIVVVERAILT